jgi:hypothetical protein
MCLLMLGLSDYHISINTKADWGGVGMVLLRVHSLFRVASLSIAGLSIAGCSTVPGAPRLLLAG